MNKTFSLLFFVKRSKTIANGTAPIYLRITIDGKLTELAVKRYIHPDKWNSQTQKVNGTSEEIKSINAYLKTVELQVYEAHHELLKDKLSITAETLKQKLLGTDERQRMLVPIFHDHNRKVETLVNDEFSPSTYKRYCTSLKHTIDFLKWKYNVSDIDIRRIDHAFITEFEFYLRSVRKCNNNSAVKYIRNFGKIVRICIANDWIDKNPFINFKSKVKEVDRVFLSEEEIQALSSKVFVTERLNQVRDIFIFSCFTGLAYIDVKKLTKANIVIGIDGERWIYTNRQKTDSRSNIPLLPMAAEIITKYKEHPQCLNEGRLLPVLSNQKMNSYLKEMADVCGITKELTFHIARHTFATAVTLTKWSTN